MLRYSNCRRKTTSTTSSASKPTYNNYMKLTAFSPHALYTTLWTNDFVLWVLITWCSPRPQSLLKTQDKDEIPNTKPLKYEHFSYRGKFIYLYLYSYIKINIKTVRYNQQKIKLPHHILPQGNMIPHYADKRCMQQSSSFVQVSHSKKATSKEG